MVTRYYRNLLRQANRKRKGKIEEPLSCSFHQNRRQNTPRKKILIMEFFIWNKKTNTLSIHTFLSFIGFRKNDLPFVYTKTILFSKIENMPEMACQIFLNAKNALMDEMKSSIRKFLALTKMTRDEFADLCGVSKSQVDKWLSTVPIPRARQRLIIRIMKEEYAKQARLAQTKIRTASTFPLLLKSMKSSGMKLNAMA